MTPQQQTLKDRGICVIIPTYNNAGTIAHVVKRALEQCADVIVVCDGCTDDTLQRLDALENKPVVVNLPKNAGKGTALKKGFQYALKQGFAYAITLDADAQHYPEDIPLLLAANQKHPGAIVVGERKNLETMERSAGSKFANAFSNFWFAVQTGQYLKDTQTGYRLYPLKKLYGISLLTSRYEAELELLVFASWHGVKIVNQPVNVFYPSREERVSHFRPGKDFTRISVLNTILCVLALVYALPLAILRKTYAVVKTVYLLLVFVFATLFVLTPLIHLYLKIGGITEKKKENLHRIFNVVTKFARKRIPGVTYSESNPHGEDFSKPAVIICNHQSHLDLVSLLAVHQKMVILTAQWVWNNPLYRYAIRNADFLPASEGMEKILPQLKVLVEKGYSVAIYPEGTRSLDGSIGRFHQGAFYLADQLNIDIVPLVLYGSGRALPKHKFLLRKWPMHLEIDQRIAPDTLKQYGKTYFKQASHMRQYYIKRLEQIANRIEQHV
jgi:1-acyl-sn-glycerol-3-phosphate acyltransferase